MRTLLGVNNDVKIIATKDRLDLMLIHGAMLFEAIKTFVSYGKHFKSLTTFKNEENKFKEIFKLHGDKKSFKNTILYKIRNKVFFHFDKDVIPDTLPKILSHDGITFLRANSKNNKDIIYSLSDDIVLACITDCEIEKGDGAEIYKSIEDNIINISKLLGELIDKIISELLNKKVELIKDEA